MAVQVPNKPSYQSALVQVNRIIAPEWLRWFNQIQSSSAAVANLELELAALAALVATDQANIATLQAQMLAVQTAQAAADAAIAALQTSVTNLRAISNLHTLQLATQQAEIDALQAAGLQIDLTDQWSNARDLTPQMDELRRLFATLDTPRDYTPQIEELRRLFATLETAQNYSRDIQELRLLFATLDVALTPAILAGQFQPVLTFPLTLAQGGTNATTAPLARTSLAVPGLADANVFTNALNTFLSINLNTASASLTGSGTAGTLQICPGTANSDSGIFIAGLGNANNGLYINSDHLFLRNAASSVVFALLASAGFTINVPVVSAVGSNSVTPTLSSGVSSGGVNIVSGVSGTDARIFLGGTTSGVPGVYIDSPSSLFLRSLVGTQLAEFNFATQQVNIGGPILGTLGGWISWTPTATPSAGSLSSVSYDNHEYIRIGPIVFIKFTARFTTSVGCNVAFSLPVAAIGATSVCVQSFFAAAPGYGNLGGSVVTCTMPGGSFPVGANIIFVEGFYQV